MVLPLKVGGNATQGLMVLPLGLFGIAFLRAVFEVKDDEPLELLYDQVVRTGQLRI